MKVIINNNEYNYPNKTTLEKISKDFNGYFLCAKVNNRVRDLNERIENGSTIEFLGLDNKFAIKIYEATLRYIIAMAVNNIFKGTNIKFSNSISMSLYAKLVGKIITQTELTMIEDEVKRIIDADLKIKKEKYSIDEMIEYYTSLNYLDKVENLKYRKEMVNVNTCSGYRNYMYSFLAPSTGYIKNFKFILYHKGFIIQFPRKEMRGEIPEFNDEPNFIGALSKANKWASLTQSENIYEINKKAENKEELTKFINVCETRHYHQLNEIGDKIEKNIDKIRLIAIAGPSSSGKTTFSKRLEIELLSRNIHPLRISLDNYYLHPDACPLDEFGKPDFEHIESLNLDLFRQNMLDFIEGKEVRLPIYNFKTKETTFKDPIKLNKDSLIIIEGIHALNEKLTSYINKENKFKIYICPLQQRNIDNHNPISLTDLRLIRRIVRDKNFRNTTALKTLSTWDSVRRGERTWIYPHMEEADYIFNSELGYELLILKKYGLESLREIKDDTIYCDEANMLIKFLKIYQSVSNEAVPNNSLIKEFMGGSIFKED